MSQQKALFLQAPNNGEFIVGTKDIPKPGPGQLLIKIHAAALNPLDWKIRAYGLYVEKYPAILGCDASGTVEEIGEGVNEFEKGDRVYEFPISFRYCFFSDIRERFIQGSLSDDRANF